MVRKASKKVKMVTFLVTELGNYLKCLLLPSGILPEYKMRDSSMIEGTQRAALRREAEGDNRND